MGEIVHSQRNHNQEEDDKPAVIQFNFDLPKGEKGYAFFVHDDKLFLLEDFAKTRFCPNSSRKFSGGFEITQALTLTKIPGFAKLSYNIMNEKGISSLKKVNIHNP